jgi:hypothetical protein
MLVREMKRTLPALFVLFLASTAHATKGEVSLELGYGTEPTRFGSDIRGYLNPMGVGFGLAAGVDIHGFYAGVSTRFFQGESRIGFVSLDPNAPPANIYGSAIQIGTQLGYGLSLWRFTARLYVWTGATVVSFGNDANICAPSQNGFTGLFCRLPIDGTGSTTRFTIAPGAVVHARIVGPLFVGVDGRMSIIVPRQGILSEQTGTEMTLMGAVGVSL